MTHFGELNLKIPSILDILMIYEQFKFQSQLSWAWKKVL